MVTSRFMWMCNDSVLRLQVQFSAVLRADNILVISLSTEEVAIKRTEKYCGLPALVFLADIFDCHGDVEDLVKIVCQAKATYNRKNCKLTVCCHQPIS